MTIEREMPPGVVTKYTISNNASAIEVTPETQDDHLHIVCEDQDVSLYVYSSASIGELIQVLEEAKAQYDDNR